jgi:tRNA(Arg) A34 adenosine deaminase TadA
MTPLDPETQREAMRRAFDLARDAVANGDGPYGTVLVVDGDIVMEERNEVTSSGDLRLHPELTIAHRVGAELDAETAASAAMVTSTEPCAMCAKGVADTHLGEIIYSVSGSRNSELRNLDHEGIPSEEVFERYGAETAVSGPVLPEEGAELIREAYGIDE